MYADLVCKGGGMKGIALVGALSYFEEKGYVWKRVAGTSVGAILASLIAVGYDANEIKEIMYSLDFAKFADKDKLQSIPLVGPVTSLFLYKGLHSGDYVENFLTEKFEQKGKKYFRDIYFGNKSRLKVIATDVTRHKLIILPDDLVEYNINPLDFEIAKAVRMSLSIPFFYDPVVLNVGDMPCYIVDGGLLSNFPIWLFDVANQPRWPTFGLNLYNNVQNPSNNSDGFIPFVIDVVETSLATNEEIYFKDCDAVRIVNIPTLGINTVDFDISKEQMDALFKSGYISAKSFLRNWNFNDYLLFHRK